MAEEHKPETPLTPESKPSDTTVTISQEKLDSLINEKFKKGAEKANAQILESLGVESIDSLKEIMKAKADADEASKSDLEKATESARKLAEENEQLSNRYKALEESNSISLLAAEHGIKELDYFRLEYAKEKDKDGFDMSAFVTGLKESKPLLFGQSQQAPKTDKSNNNQNNPGNVDLSKLSYNELLKMANQ